MHAVGPPQLNIILFSDTVLSNNDQPEIFAARRTMSVEENGVAWPQSAGRDCCRRWFFARSSEKLRVCIALVTKLAAMQRSR
jgi:hypothetical protein